jgi:hypothetical protein
MNCLDFQNEIIDSLSSEQKRHIEGCLTCRIEWENRLFARTFTTAKFNPDKQPLVGLTEKPPSDNWTPPDFCRMLQDVKKEQIVAQESKTLQVRTTLEKLYPDNPGLLKKLTSIWSKLGSHCQLNSDEINIKDFASALGYFPEKEIERMNDELLIKKCLEKIDEQDSGDL